MKKTIIRYGLFSAITMLILALTAFLLVSRLAYSIQEVFGYLSIVLATSFVYFGIRHYRDYENNGEITFGRGLLIGVLITLFAALAFGVIDYIYTAYMNPDFAQNYLAKSLQELETTLPKEEFEVEKAALIKQYELYGTSFFMALLMFVTVMLIGFVLSLISALILQKKIK